jgi:hypothetical protein
MGLAILDSRENNREETLELILYILQHPAGAQDTKNRAAALKADIQSRYSPEQIELINQRVRSKNLDDFVRQFQGDV